MILISPILLSITALLSFAVISVSSTTRGKMVAAWLSGSITTSAIFAALIVFGR